MASESKGLNQVKSSMNSGMLSKSPDFYFSLDFLEVELDKSLYRLSIWEYVHGVGRKVESENGKERARPKYAWLSGPPLQTLGP